MLKFDWRTLELEKRNTRRCDHVGCAEDGEYPAPKSTKNLSDRYYFCLDHVRAYNAEWNYFAGIKEDGANEDPQEEEKTSSRYSKFFQFFTRNKSYSDPFEILGERDPEELSSSKQSWFSPKTAEGKAFVTLQLNWPLTQKQLKNSYKKLAKEHHPDLNQGCSKSAKKFRDVKEAYELLTKLLEEVNK